jgi:hypothetical protein
MIQFNSVIQNIVSQPTVELFYLVDMGGYKVTNYFRDVTLSNGEVFEANGRLLQVDPPQLSSTVDREIYKITFADPDFYFGQEAPVSVVGLAVTVRVGFINPITKFPVTETENTVIIYRGVVDGSSYSIDTEVGGESVWLVTCASPMNDLEMARTMYTSKDSIRLVSPGDTSFDQVYEGSGQVELKWGKG